MLRELVAAGQTEPALLHFEEALTKLRVRLEPGLIRAMFGVQTALARFPTHAYKQAPLPSAPTSQFALQFSRLLEVELIVQSGKKFDMALQQIGHQTAIPEQPGGIKFPR